MCAFFAQARVFFDPSLNDSGTLSSACHLFRVLGVLVTAFTCDLELMITKAHYRGSAVALELAMEAAESYNLRVDYNIYSHDALMSDAALHFKHICCAGFI